MSDQTPTTITQPKPQVAIGNRGIELQNIDQLYRFATAVAQSGLAPKSIPTAEGIFVAVQMGMELGLPPMAALQNIAVINGRPSVWGDAQLGIVRASGMLEKFEEFYEFNGQKLARNPVTIQDGHVAVCRVKRQGCEPSEVGFSVQDAKQAGLWGKDGPWKQYPARMLRYRARAFALRDQFGDLLRGLISTEEMQDVERMKPATVSGPATTVAFPGQPPLEQEQPDTGPDVQQPTESQPAQQNAPAATPETEQDRLAAMGLGAGFTFDRG